MNNIKLESFPYDVYGLKGRNSFSFKFAVVNKIMTSPKWPCFNLQNLEYITLLDKGDLADVTKLRALQWGGCPGLSGGPSKSQGSL